jgi:hypothetical protein
MKFAFAFPAPSTPPGREAVTRSAAPVEPAPSRSPQARGREFERLLDDPRVPEPPGNHKRTGEVARDARLEARRDQDQRIDEHRVLRQREAEERRLERQQTREGAADQPAPPAVDERSRPAPARPDEAAPEKPADQTAATGEAQPAGEGAPAASAETAGATTPADSTIADAATIAEAALTSALLAGDETGALAAPAEAVVPEAATPAESAAGAPVAAATLPASPLPATATATSAAGAGAAATGVAEASGAVTAGSQPAAAAATPATGSEPAAQEAAQAATEAASNATPRAGVAQPAAEAATGRAEPAAATANTTTATPTQPAPVEQRASATAATAPAPAREAAPEIVAPLGQLPIEVGMRALKGVTEFTIRLDPGELGRVDVTLDLDDEGGVAARVVAERPETLALLQRDARLLERALDQAGLRTSPDGLQFSLRGDQGNGDGRAQQQHDGSQQALSRQSGGEEREITLDAAVLAASVGRRSLTGLDIRI